MTSEAAKQRLEALAAAKAAVGRLELKRAQGWQAVGTGFVVGDRTVLTAMHVVAERFEPTVALLGQLRFVVAGTDISIARLSGYDVVDDWALLLLDRPPGVRPLPVSSSLPKEESGWWTFGYPGLNDIEGIVANAELRDPSALYDRGTAISLVSEDLKGTQVGGLSGAPLLFGNRAYAILRSNLEEARRSFGYLYATSIARVLDRADLRNAQPNPYPGMRPFDLEHSDYFFGRERETTELIARLRSTRLALLVGGSGSGKSSLLRAGLLPRVRAGALAAAAIDTVVFQPRRRPLHELTLALFARLSFQGRPTTLEDLRAALAKGGAALADLVDQELHHRHSGDRSRGGVLVVVDQMEELYAEDVDPAEAQLLLELLCGAAGTVDGRVWVAGAFRDGFLTELLRPSTNAESLRSALVIVGPIDTFERLRELIVRPAQKAGLRFDPPDLPDQIAKDAADEPGALPLLQYALDRLWQDRSGDVLRGDVYRDFQGVRGVIAHHAQATFVALDEAGRVLAKRLFLRLVWVRADGPNTRRFLPRAALKALPPEAVLLASRFISARLLVESAEGLDIAHEALIREWALLRDWVKSAPEGERRLQEIEHAKARWAEGGEQHEDLLPPHRLRPLLDWAFRNGLDMPPAERQFLLECLLATEWRVEEWLPRFPGEDVVVALGRPGRTPEDELRLMTGLYAAGGGLDHRARRLGALVVSQANNELGAAAGRLAVEHEGAAWLIALADREPTVRNVVTGLLNEASTQGPLRANLPHSWRRTARRDAALRLAWEQRTTLLFVAATVFGAVWLTDRLLSVAESGLQILGLIRTTSYGAFGIVNMSLWAAAGGYLDRRAEILGRPLSRRELWGFTATLAATEQLLYWLPSLRALMRDSRLEWLANLGASVATYSLAAVILMPLFARQAAPGSRRPWLRLALATFVSISAQAFRQRSGQLDEDLTNALLSVVMELFQVAAAVATAGWAAWAERHPGDALPRRPWRPNAAVPVLLALLAAGAFGVSSLLPALLAPAGVLAYAERLHRWGSSTRGDELLRQVCEEGYVDGCRALASWAREDTTRAWAWEQSCRHNDIEGCRTWLQAQPSDALEPKIAACERTRAADICDLARGAVFETPGVLGTEAWRAAADRLCDASVASACVRLADALAKGTWLPADPALASEYRRRACIAGAADLCPEPLDERTSPAMIEDCTHGRLPACESLPPEEVYRLAEQVERSDPWGAELYRLACEGGIGDSCLAYGELRATQRRLLAALTSNIPAEIQIPVGFSRKRLFPQGTVVGEVSVPWESNSLTLLEGQSTWTDLALEFDDERPRFATACHYSSFAAFLPLSGPLPNPFSGANLAPELASLTQDPPTSRADREAWCRAIENHHLIGTPAALSFGGALLFRVSRPGVYDVLSELRTWPLADRSVVVAWRVLKTWPAPQLRLEPISAP